MKRRTGITIVFILLGLIYGHFSAVFNQNPYYPVPGQHGATEENKGEAWNWQPSPLWLPSYLLCKVPRNGFGVTHTKSGYLFRSQADRIVYFGSSIILGGLIGCFAGSAIHSTTRKKRESKE
jgi:hypothetical protein